MQTKHYQILGFLSGRRTGRERCKSIIKGLLSLPQRGYINMDEANNSGDAGGVYTYHIPREQWENWGRTQYKTREKVALSSRNSTIHYTLDSHIHQTYFCFLSHLASISSSTMKFSIVKLLAVTLIGYAAASPAQLQKRAQKVIIGYRRASEVYPPFPSCFNPPHV